jgi:superfamily II DNA/RNA helicase
MAKNYVHRIGRSARAGRFGAAITFVTQYDLVLLQEIEVTQIYLNGKNLTKWEKNYEKPFIIL